MRVIMRSTCAGPTGTYLAGKTVTVSDEEGKHFLAQGYAVPAEEKAAAQPALVETASARGGSENASLSQRLSKGGQEETAEGKGDKGKAEKPAKNTAEGKGDKGK